MLVSFRWLQELCPVDADVAEVAHRISLAGLEVEAMEEKGIVSAPTPGSGTREILDYGQAAPPVDED